VTWSDKVKLVGGSRQDGGFKINEREKCMDALGQVIGHSDLKTG